MSDARPDGVEPLFKPEREYTVEEVRAKRSEATTKGGNMVLQKYGREFYRMIGKRGGEVLRDMGTDFAKLGAKGGNVTLDRHGKEHYQTIGSKGGKISKRTQNKE